MGDALAHLRPEASATADALWPDATKPKSQARKNSDGVYGAETQRPTKLDALAGSPLAEAARQEADDDLPY